MWSPDIINILRNFKEKTAVSIATVISDDGSIISLYKNNSSIDEREYNKGISNAWKVINKLAKDKRKEIFTNGVRIRTRIGLIWIICFLSSPIFPMYPPTFITKEISIAYKFLIIMLWTGWDFFRSFSLFT